jgi:hypothetical protein
VDSTKKLGKWFGKDRAAGAKRAQTARAEEVHFLVARSDVYGNLYRLEAGQRRFAS